MITFGESVTIRTTTPEIFSYLSAPSNYPEFWSSLVKVEDVQPLPEGRYKARYTYKMAGIPFEGTAEFTEIIPNRTLVISTRGSINSVLTWVFRSQNDQTKVTLTVDYEVPIPLLGNLAESIVKRLSEQELTFMLNNLRTLWAFSHIMYKNESL